MHQFFRYKKGIDLEVWGQGRLLKGCKIFIQNLLYHDQIFTIQEPIFFQQDLYTSTLKSNSLISSLRKSYTLEGYVSSICLPGLFLWETGKLQEYVLIYQDCHNQVSQTRWLKQQRCIFSTLLQKAERSRYQQDWFLLRP